MAVGIFDSGLGGLTVLEACANRLPAQSFIYMGDNLNAPYGVRDTSNIFDLTTKCIERMWEEDCDLVILACNTASAAALKQIQEEWLPKNKKVLGVFVPLIESLTNRNWGDNSPPREVGVKNVALFATPSTVASRAFQRELAFRAIGVDVESQACGLSFPRPAPMGAYSQQAGRPRGLRETTLRRLVARWCRYGTLCHAGRYIHKQIGRAHV